jgi:CRP-like cAMP-binding protein
LFQGLRRSARKRVDSLGAQVRVANGRVLIKQGGRDGCLYVVVGGSAIIQRNGVEVHLLGPGDWFGELGAMTDGGAVATASVIAFSDLEVRVYDPREFASLVDAAPVVQERLLRSMLRTACELVTVHDGDVRARVLDPAERTEGTKALHDSLA